MNDHLQPSAPPSPIRRALCILAFLGAAAGAVGILYLRRMGPTVDFAMSNVLSTMLGIVVWMLVVVGLQLSSLPRVFWRTGLLLPVLSVIVFFLLFRLERLDGELKPQFRARWEAPPELPTAENNAEAIPAIDWEPSPEDFAQFLGPNRDGIVTGLELETDWSSKPPEVLWKIPIGDGWSGFAIQGDVAVTMEQRNEQEWVTAYDMGSGELLWNYAIDSKHTNVMGGTGPRSTPLIEGSRVFACSAVSKFVCLDLANGSEVWSQELLDLAGCSQADFELKVAWGRSASPLLWNSQILIPLGGASAPLHSLIAFDAETGEERWRAGDSQISYSSPSMMTLCGTEQVLLLTENSLKSFDPGNQEELWSVVWPGSSSAAANVSQPIQVADNQILLTKGYGQGCKLIEIGQDENTWSAEPIWTNEVSLRTKFTSAVVADGFAYGLSDGILECVDLESGKRRWKRGRYQQGQLLLIGSNLVITSEKGKIVVVAADPDEFRELAELPVIGDVSWNTPAISGNRFVMRNSDEAACLLLPTLASQPNDAPSVETENAEL